MRRLTMFAAALGTLAALSPATPALATSYYAAPGTTNVAGCGAANPCELRAALTKPTSAADEVVVNPGDYYASGTTPYGMELDANAGTVHGIDGSSAPRIHASVAALSSALKVASGVTARFLEIDNGNTGSALELAAGTARAERVVARDSAVGAGCQLGAGSVILDSVCEGAAQGVLVSTSSASVTATARNVTAIGTGSSGKGLEIIATGDGLTTFPTAQLNMSNSIARAVGTGTDASLNGNLGGTSKLWADHSNFRTPTRGPSDVFQDNGTNQTGPTAAVPLFVNAPGGDYRQAAGSPTIDHGLTDPANGPLDFEGDPRALGASTDIGADEFRPLPPGGGSGGGPPPPGRDDLPATISAVSIGKLWRLGSLLPRASRRRRPPIGTIIAFTLSEPARVTLEFSQPKTGRKVGRACKKLTRANRRKRKCTIPNMRGNLPVSGHTGNNKVRFQGRLSRTRKLKPGAYLLTVRATDTGGNRSTPKSVRFTIAP